MKQVVITIEDDEEIKWVDGVLTKIKKNDEPKSIMDRVKSYEDACEELGVSPLSEIALEENLLALSKLETIIKALNEGWVATEHMDDEWWYPWFYRFDKNNKDKYKDYVMARSSCVSHSDGGVAFATAASDVPYMNSSYCSRLALKSMELAKYCGKQFIDLWTDYLLG